MAREFHRESTESEPFMDETTRYESRVLVADDDPAIRQLVCTIVTRERLAVDCVADGIEVIEKLQQRDYAVILLDLMMPRLDGFGVLDYMKAHPPEHKPVIMVITAYADQKFKQVDPTIVAGVLRKPFEVADLGSLIRLCASGFDYEVSQKLHLPGGEEPHLHKMIVH
ncbi:MAG: two component, sigma54 specific, transcriptional regulator, Fis family [Acidobacteria bacterium]|nr:two component, sigma54 specific, transcriptional regulator, Fis family [Acidobacteriota bacterium]